MEFPPPPPREANKSSTGCLKAGLIGCGGAFLLFVLVGVAGAIFFARSGPNLMAGIESAKRDGITAARTTDEAGCAAAAETRARKGGMMAASTSAASFLESCLRSSKPTPGFCAGVPSSTDFVRSSAWQRMRCQARALDPRDVMACSATVPPIQQFCTTGQTKVDPDSALAHLRSMDDYRARR